MKGIIIYENPMWGDNEGATYCEYINNASFELTQYAPKTIISRLEGAPSETSKAVCSKDDTYDFETGALIALMKMCGVDKVVRACNEAFSEDTFKTYATKYERELNTLKKDFDKVRDLKDFYKKNYNELIEEIKKLKKEKEQIIVAKSILNNKLIEENSNLSYIKSCNESTIKSLENTRDLLINKNNELIEENKDLKKNIDELFESEQHSKSELGRLYFEKHRLEEKVEKLKIDCEKLQHGYNDIDNVPSGYWDGDILDIVFLPGRACGKEYKALVELFKKIDQKKVDAAYKEAYGRRVIWCSSQSSTRDMLDSLLETCKYAIPSNNHTEWLYKIPTKREVMWKNIKNFKGDSCIEVNRADVIDFLKELEEEMPEVHWVSGRKPTDIPYHMFNYKYTHEYDKVYFFIDDRYITYDFDKQTSRTNVQYVIYLPPMRWDLFKKGRLAVKVTYNNYKEFYEACKKELGKRPSVYPYMTPDDVTISICKKDGLFEIFTIEDQKKTGRKIVDWEDVR